MLIELYVDITQNIVDIGEPQVSLNKQRLNIQKKEKSNFMIPIQGSFSLLLQRVDHLKIL